MFTNRYSHMVHEYYVRRLREIMARRHEKMDSLKTRKDAELYVRYVRDAVAKSFPELPAKRAPLKAEITGRDEYGNYFIEKVIFESRPGFKVTGNLYLPKDIAGKIPGILGLCGHSGTGKAEPAYQSFCIGLVQRGFMVFIIDPIHQGERPQFHKKDYDEIPSLCNGHNLIGNQMVLIYDFFGSWRLWDAIRGLDYLLSRPEVDASRIGVTGNSGGGTMTTYLTAFDPRVTMSAPSCYICSYLANMENELPSDAEQCPPGILAHGLDQADLLICRAPKPIMIMGQHDDFFDIRYTKKSFADLKKIYRLLGSEKNAGLFIGPRSHGFFIENREEMYRWFMHHSKIKGTNREKDVLPLEHSKLHVIPGGDVMTAKSLKAIDFIRGKANEYSSKRKKLSPDKLRAVASKLLNMPQVKGAPHYKGLLWAGGSNPELRKGVEFAVETEPGIDVIVAIFGPCPNTMHPPTGKMILYVGNESSQDDIANIKEIRKLATGKIPLCAVDPRGLGQSLAKTCGKADIFEPYGADYLYASTGEMLGESYFGRRVFDVMRTMDFLYAKGATEIGLVGRGMGSLITVFAALMHDSKPHVRIINYLPSYESIIESSVYKWPLSSLIRGALKHFDLPDIYKVLSDRLLMEKPWNARMEKLN